MQELILAAAVFIGIHIVSSTPLRPMVVGKFGEHVYRAIFAGASLVAIVWLSRAYNNAPATDVLWSFGSWATATAGLLVLVAAILVVTGMASPNPAAMGGEVALRGDAAKGIMRITRHPVMSGIALWGIAHLLTNGDLASMVFFGAFTLLAVVGPFLIDRKRRAAVGDAWNKYAAVTSAVPFAAIITGRNQLKLDEIGWGRMGASLVIYLALYLSHAWLFGVAPHP